MKCKGFKTFAYIDNFILINPKAKAQQVFDTLTDLLQELGLPMNNDKRSPPTRVLIYLGIHIDGTYFKTYLGFTIFMNLPTDIILHNILTFLQYLYQNSISVKVIKNYLSSISTMASFYNLDHSAVSHPLTTRFIRGLSLHSPFRPTPRGVFDVPTLYLISQQCDNSSDPILFRAIFLTAFYGFLRMSNIAPHSLKQFDPNKHFRRQDLIFAPPGAHLILKWCKTMQDNKSHHVIQIPQIDNYCLC